MKIELPPASFCKLNMSKVEVVPKLWKTCFLKNIYCKFAMPKLGKAKFWKLVTNTKT